MSSDLVVLGVLLVLVSSVSLTSRGDGDVVRIAGSPGFVSIVGRLEMRSINFAHMCTLT